MPNVRQQVWARGNLGMCRHTVRFDPRCRHNLIRRDVAQTLANIHPAFERQFVQTPTGRQIIRAAMSLSLLVQGHKLHPGLIVVDRLDEEIEIGRLFLRLWSIKLDPKRNRLLIDPKAIVLRA